MARVRGKDLIIEALEVVHAMEATVDKLQLRFDVMADQTRELQGKTATLEQNVHELQGHTRELQIHTRELQSHAREMEAVQGHMLVTMAAYGETLDRHGEAITGTRALLREHSGHLVRLAKLLTTLAEDSDGRLTDVERRLTALERSR